MRKHTKYVGAMAAASALVAGYASAGTPEPVMQSAPTSVESAFSGEVHVGYSTQYEFRFVDLGSDLIEAGVDLS